MTDLVCGQSSQPVSLISAPLRGRPMSWWVSEDVCDDGSVGGNETACLSKSSSYLRSSSTERHQKIISFITPATQEALAVPLRGPTVPFVVGMSGTSISAWNQDSELKTSQTW